MYRDPTLGFLTLQQASLALQERLRGLLEEAQAQHDEVAVARYVDRLQYIADLTAAADPDDIFEQDSFRRMFTVELNELDAGVEGW